MHDTIIKLSKLENKKLGTALKKISLVELKKAKEYLDDVYYNSGEKSGFSDSQYDILKETILKLDKDYVDTVGAKLRHDDNRTELPLYLGSIDKIRPTEQNKLDNWLAKNSASFYNIEPKLDGVSCLFTSVDGKTSLYTRGDGYVGADISYLIKYIKNIPSITEDISVRGELIIKENVFKRKYSALFTNPRNMVSGVVNSKSLRDGVGDVDFIAYEIILNDKKQIKPSDQLKILDKLKFTAIENLLVDSLNFEDLSEKLLDFKQKCPYEIDGIIIQSNKEYVRNIKDNPKYTFAFKMTLDSNLVDVEVENVEWNISKHKLLKPRIKIKPVFLNGVTISYTPGFNAKYVVDNSIGKGSILKITRSGDVIPFIVEVIKKSKKPDMPTIDYKWNENGIDIIAEDDEFNTSDIKMISSFFSSMGIKNLSDATVEKIFNSGFDTLLKIFEADAEDFEKIDGFGKKLAEKVFSNIHNGLKNITIDVLLGSSGVFGEGMGKRKTKLLFDNVPDLMDVYVDMSDKELRVLINGIDGFSDISTSKIINNLPKASAFLKSVSPFVSFTKKEKKVTWVSNLTDTKILFSGFRDSALEKNITDRGGKMVTSISKNTSMLVVKDKSESSSKIIKARELGIDIFSKDEFVSKYIL